MTDMEKVIKGLEICMKEIECTGCPYEDECFDIMNDRQVGESMMRDAIAMLKEQEQIVRCKDCKHGTSLSDGVWCNKYIPARYPSPDWFCADGEPKT